MEEKVKSKKESLVEKEKKKYNELNDKYLRVLAEMQNIKRRNSEEVSKLLKYESEDLIKDLLNVLDNFERAITINSDTSSEELKKYLDGFEMIYASLIGILKEKGVKEIECLNEEFDPLYEEAVLTESKDKVSPNIVIDVLQKGYIYNDKVIRPAMVKVSE